MSGCQTSMQRIEITGREFDSIDIEILIERITMV